MAIVIGILKFILTLLAVLIIAALIVIALILFAPVRYKVQGSFTDEIPSARAEAKWLAGLLNVKAVYDKEEGLSAYVSVFSHRIRDIIGGDDSDEDEDDITERDISKQDITERDVTESHIGAADVSLNYASQEDTDKQHTGNTAEMSEDGVKAQGTGDNTEIGEDREITGAAGDTENAEAAEAVGAAEKRKLRISVYEAGRPVKRQICELREKGISLKTIIIAPFKAARKVLQRAADALSHGVDKAEAKLKAAACRLKEISLRIIRVIRLRGTQLKELKAVWDDKRYAKGKALLLDRIVKLLLELKPRHGSGYIRIGRGDPYSTAQAAQLAAFLYPFYADTIEFIPDFDQSILEGSIDAGGRLRLIVPVEAGLRICFSKELKAMYARVKQILGRD